MVYKGEDLDLRTPPTFGAVFGTPGYDQPLRRPPLHGANGTEPTNYRNSDNPVWVDETLLACCNHAYDVAFAHRAAEVRIEHLLYAITRIDAASEMLEQWGVRDAGLRRESAMVIASAIPGTGTDTPYRPHGSQAFKEALDQASAHAHSANTAAGIPDLLHVLIYERRDLPGAELLHRHVGTNTQRPASPSPIAPNQIPSNQVSPHPTTIQPPTDRQAQPMPPNPSHDYSQDQRIEALEALLRTLGYDVNASPQQPPQAPAYQGRPYQYASAPQPYFAPPPPPRQTNKHSADGEFANVGNALLQKLDEVSRTLSRFDQRLTSLEHAIGNDKSRGSVEIIEVADRIARIEDLLTSNSAGSIDLGPLDTRLNDIEVALLSQDSATGGSTNVDDQFDDLRDGFAHSMDNLRHGLNEQIDKLNQNSATQLKDLDDSLSKECSAREQNSAAVSAELKALAGATATHAAGAKRQVADVREAIGKLGEIIVQADQENTTSRTEFVDELREVHDAIMKLNANQHTMAESITGWQRDHVTGFDKISSRIAKIDENTAKPMDELQRMSSSVASLSTNMDTMYRATVARYHRRNRMWYWLFGTDDWIGASWPSQTARIENELHAIKQRREAA